MVGRRQKRALERSSSSHEPKRLNLQAGSLSSACPLAISLLNKWAWGQLSAPDAQDLAQSAKLSGISCTAIDILASCGTHGLNPGSTHRDMLRKFNLLEPLLPPMPFEINVPYMDPKGDKVHSVLGSTGIMLPSDWLHSLSHDTKSAIVLEELLGLGKLVKFWEHQDLSNPKLAFVTRQRNFVRRAVPIVIHGDGAAFENRDSLVSLSFSGLLKEGQIVDTHLLMAAYPKGCAAKGLQIHSKSSGLGWLGT